ncbi:AbrB family transcriptional regulator [Conexibacter woesei]|uniref:AbrB family transcriptional regulator n=1 Tax=Conexibacter woesei TaxID=191495 RepID=UPI0004104909|nr:AbrB family transcriptional regulator [Conexibacter woesei]
MAAAAGGLVLSALGLPSPYLFGALLVGLAFALAPTGRLGLAVPDPAFTGAQAVVGVVLGAYLQSSSLKALGDDWLPVALVSAATLAVSLLAGDVTARVTGLDRVTAALGTIAGGASGITTMARELGGDDRLVAFMQYLRVLVVVLITPVVAALAFPGDGSGGTSGSAGAPPVLGSVRDWVLTLGLALLGGGVLNRVLRIPAGALLWSMLLSGIVTLNAPSGWFAAPAAIQDAAFALIGLQVGLRFTMATVRQTGALLIPVLISVLALLAACFGLAIILNATTSASLADCYLATTPGGIYAVLAAAVGAGANTTFIIAVQGLRVVVMVVLAPLAVRRLVSRPRRPAAGPATSA